MALDDVRKKLDKDGRLPGVKLEVFPLDQDREPFTIEKFNSYSFASNILIPVDTFSFTFKPAPPIDTFSRQKSADGFSTYDTIVREGDTVQLTVDGEAIATGYVDTVDTEIDPSGGARLTVNGRDLMGFLEDNDAVNPDATILYANVAQINDVLPTLLKNTRIRGFETKNMPTDVKSLFATQPGESKLAALQRFLDPLNALAWMGPTGKLICGRPSFNLSSQGVLGIRALDMPRVANVLNWRTHRASGQIPNAVLPIWLGNESVQTINKHSLRQNAAEGPARLYKAGHRIYRTIVTSAPDANDVKSGLPEVSRLIAQGANYLDSLAAREMARENVNELLVTCSVIGHLNAEGDPYASDQCFDLVCDVDGLEKKMYLFAVEYALSEDAGQVTHLSFCNLNTIVADGPAS